MQAFGEAFYGRSAAYDRALAAGHEALAQALGKNIFSGGNIEKARQLASYAEGASPASLGLTTRRCWVGRGSFLSRIKRTKSNEQTD